MTKRFVPVFIALLLVATACGGSDADSANDDTQAPSTTGAATTDTESASDPAPDTTVAQAEEVASSGGGSGTATLTFDNGESYEFSILCALEPQVAAGQEILFNFVSYDEPFSLDVTQFGDDSVSPGGASISVYDTATYETLWDASSIYGSDVTLSLNGSTVTGSGVFLENGEFGGAEAHGELEANC
jgi:hypothetical protein